MLTGFVVAAVLAGTVPAVAPDEPVVTLSWAGTPYEYFQATWTEPDPVRNRVDLVRTSDGTAVTSSIVEPDQPNRGRWPIEPVAGTGTYRVAVYVVDAGGQVVGEPAWSPVFDTDLPPAVDLDAVTPRPDGTVVMRWTYRTPVDETPGDPLDVPATDPPTAVPVRSGDWPYTVVELSGPVTGTSFVAPADPRPPYWIGLRTSNEWGTEYANTHVYSTRVTASIPPRAVDGSRLRITGVAYESRRACDLAACWPAEFPAPDRTVHLESRTGAAAPWRVVATARTAADGTYRFGVVTRGPRQYRVVAPVAGSDGEDPARAYAATAPAAVRLVPVTVVTEPAGGAGAGESLPITGAPAGVVAVIGLLLVLLGVLLRVAGRRTGT